MELFCERFVLLSNKPITRVLSLYEREEQRDEVCARLCDANLNLMPVDLLGLSTKNGLLTSTCPTSVPSLYSSCFSGLFFVTFFFV
jgi:hypothetical protein